MDLNQAIKLSESVPAPISPLMPEFNVVLVYEDFEMATEGKRLFERMAREAGLEESAQLSVWRFDLLDEPTVIEALSRAATGADMIVIAPRHADWLPSQLAGWLKQWPAQRRADGGALVAVFHPACRFAGENAAIAMMERAAARAGMEFFCCTGPARPAFFQPHAGWLRAQPVPAGPWSAAPISSVPSMHA